MRRLLPALALLAACSSDPVPPADVPRGDGCPVDRDGACLVSPLDVPQDTVAPDVGFDAGAVDAGVDVGMEATLSEYEVDVQAPDVSTVPDVQAMDSGTPEDRVDAVAVADVQAEDAVDAGTAEDRPDVAAVADRPDVVDVPVDVPVDGGPVVYDLDTARTGVEYVVLHRRLPERAGGIVVDCVSPPTATSCSISGGRLDFAFRQCSTDFVGSFSIENVGDRGLSLSTSGAGNFAPSPRFAAGTRITGSPARRSFHIQFARAAMGSEPGATGIPGRTIDPALGDIWILGCPSD